MWREMTEDDLTGAMTRLDIETFKKSGNWQGDPVKILLEREAAQIRAYIRTNGKVEMSPNPLEVPESCIAPALDIVAYRLALRMNKDPGEGRKEAKKAADKFFESISRRWVTPEAYGKDEAETTAGPCAQVVKGEPSKLRNLEGL